MKKIKLARKISPFRESAKYIIRAYKEEHGVYPSVKEAVELTGFSRIVVETALDVVIAEEGKIPEIKYTKKQIYQLEAKLKILSKKLENEFNERVRLKMLEQNKDYLSKLERLQKEASEKYSRYTDLINNYKPIFSEDEFRTIIACLHPDNSASKEKRETAFYAFNMKRFQLTGKK
jgi:hypothetical protein